MEGTTGGAMAIKGKEGQKAAKNGELEKGGGGLKEGETGKGGNGKKNHTRRCLESGQ